MQMMLAAFLQTNTKNSGIQSVQVDQIGRTYPPLFTINLPKEKEILDDFCNGICCTGHYDYHLFFMSKQLKLFFNLNLTV